MSNQTHFADDATLATLMRYYNALREIVDKAPANGEDVSYLIAREALKND